MQTFRWGILAPGHIAKKFAEAITAIPDAAVTAVGSRDRGRAEAFAARRSNLFLMEALWTRFLPALATARGWIDAGRIGALRRLEADFSFRGGWDPESRLLNPALAGGGLLDVGIYVT